MGKGGPAFPGSFWALEPKEASVDFMCAFR